MNESRQSPDFQFINVTGPENPMSASSRRAVRAHVMRTFHKQKRTRHSNANNRGVETRSLRPRLPTNKPSAMVTQDALMVGLLGGAVLEVLTGQHRLPVRGSPKMTAARQPLSVRLFQNDYKHVAHDGLVSTCSALTPWYCSPSLYRETSPLWSAPAPPLPAAFSVSRQSLELLHFCK
jgi:hypothetical protein